MPSAVLDGLLCERFHCLPSELDEEDGVRLFDVIYAQQVARAFQNKKRGRADASDEAIIAPILRADFERQK